jgi:hypothetical protein
MSSPRRRIWTLAGVMALATIFMLPVSAASAGTAKPALATSISPEALMPRSATECNPNPIQAGSQCTSVKGTGTYVDSIGAQFHSRDYGDLDHLHQEIYGPGGLIENCKPFDLSPLGVSDVCLWVNPHPHVHVTQGNYCSRTWQVINKKDFIVSSECVDVRS